MRVLFESNKYLKDIKKVTKQGKDLNLLFDVLEYLLLDKPLEPKYKDHQLKGTLKDFRELHITPDWLLIYRLEENTLNLIRTGSHSELFK